MEEANGARGDSAGEGEAEETAEEALSWTKEGVEGVRACREGREDARGRDGEVDDSLQPAAYDDIAGAVAWTSRWSGRRRGQLWSSEGSQPGGKEEAITVLFLCGLDLTTRHALALHLMR